MSDPVMTTSEAAADQALITAAIEAQRHGYAPYSHFLVGAAIADDTGGIHRGANVENAAYPESVCAEGGAISAMVLAGGRRIRAIAVAGGKPDDGMICTPCGGCRQKIREFATPETPVLVCGPEGLRQRFTLRDLLPAAFGPDHLAE